MTTTISDFVIITPALTTVYTTPSECFNRPYTLDDPEYDSTELNQSLWPDPLCTETGWHGCYPQSKYFYSSCASSASNSLILDTIYMGQTFSPGVCPDDQTVILYSVSTRTNGNKITVVTCCPSTFTANGDACYKTLTTASPLILVTRDTETYHNLITVGTTTISTHGRDTTFIFQVPITVAWEESDLPLFTPASAPLKMLGIATTTSANLLETATSLDEDSHTNSGSLESSMSPKTSDKSKSGDSSGDLTSTQKRHIGIGVGCVVGFLLLLGVGVGFFLWKSHRKIVRDSRSSA